MLISNVLNSASYFSDMDGSCSGQDLEGLLGSGQVNVFGAISDNVEPSMACLDVTVLSEAGLCVPGDTSEVMLLLSNLT